MNKTDLIKNGFYVALTGTDEEKRAIAIEVIDKAVAAGAELVEGVDDIHKWACVQRPHRWNYIGVQNGGTFFYSVNKLYGPNATELTLQQFRDLFSDGWIEWHGGDCPVKPDTVVEFKLRNGRIFNDIAIYLTWQHLETPYTHDILETPYAHDIIAYRVVSEGNPVTYKFPKQPVPFNLRVDEVRGDDVNSQAHYQTEDLRKAAWYLNKAADLIDSYNE